MNKELKTEFKTGNTSRAGLQQITEAGNVLTFGNGGNRRVNKTTDDDMVVEQSSSLSNRNIEGGSLNSQIYPIDIYHFNGQKSFNIDVGHNNVLFEVTINDDTELKKFNRIMFNNEFSNEQKIILKKIKSLAFKVNVQNYNNKNINDCLSYFVAKPEIAGQLRTLSFGNLGEGAQIEISNQFTSLSSFKCGNIGIENSFFSRDTVSLTFQGLPSLVSFECGVIFDKGSVIFPKQLNSLTSFKCERIECGASVTYPEQLNSLISFTCGDIGSWKALGFPLEFPSLTSFEVGDMGFVRFTVPRTPKLISLKYGRSSQVEELADWALEVEARKRNAITNNLSISTTATTDVNACVIC
ncbi:MAG: hypothetical protein C5B43_02950 [Verrucomicrobia bacterium]|nr:MAG: hypothetical protein C5B43_02950 [Verrucomicrobiota bacterium]